MNCKLCNVVLSSQEVATYGSRCENCWCRPTLKPAMSLLDHGAADLYNGYPTVENASEITNQGTPVGNYKARRRRIKK